MQKRAITQPAESAASKWLDLESKAEVEITSEDPARPIESALRPGGQPGWRAADPGPQTIRLVFDEPQRISQVRLRFTERETERTQEFVLGWTEDRSRPFREIVRQQWNFSPQGSTEEVEEYRLKLEGAAALELKVNPDISGRKAFASLQEFRVA